MPLTVPERSLQHGPRTVGGFAHWPYLLLYIADTVPLRLASYVLNQWETAMDLGLNGKLALVTGSTAGIGFATAEALAREGARVILNGRTQSRVDGAIAKLRQALPAAQVSGIAADVSVAAGCAQVVKTHPDVDVLVNNMGIFEPRPFEEIADSDWMRFFEANVMSGVRLSRHYVKGMRARNWGRIVFVSSESGLQIPT